jgi:hypothetical protein
MPVDVSMYRANPLRSVEDYQGDYNKLDAQNQALQQGAIALQQAAPKFQAEMALKAAQTQADLAKGRHSGAQADAEQYKLSLDKIDNSIKDISNATTTADFYKLIVKHLDNKEIDDATASQLFSRVPTDPAQIPAFARALTMQALSAKDKIAATAPKVVMANQGNQFQAFNENADAGPVGPIPGVAPIPINESANNASNNERASADAAAQRAVTMRGQNMADQRARDLQDAGKVQLIETPDGYMVANKTTNQTTPLKTADGQSVRSSAQATKLEGAFNADRASLTGTASGLDRLREAATALKSSPGIVGITGLRGAIPDIPGSDAANAQAMFDTLKSQIGFGVLQDMRQNSKTGGALGNVSDAEGKRLEANLAALSRKQSTDELIKNLDKVIEYTDTAKARLSDAFNMKHAQFLGRNPDAPKPSVAVKIKSDEEYNALPTGALFTGPDGKTRKKP